MGHVNGICASEGPVTQKSHTFYVTQERPGTLLMSHHTMNLRALAVNPFGSVSEVYKLIVYKFPTFLAQAKKSCRA